MNSKQAADDPNAETLERIAKNSLIGTGELLLTTSFYNQAGAHVTCAHAKDLPEGLPSLKASTEHVTAVAQELSSESPLPENGKSVEFGDASYVLTEKKVGSLLIGVLQPKETGPANGAASGPSFGLICVPTSKYISFSLYKRSAIPTTGIEDKTDVNTANACELIQAITKGLSEQGL